MTNVLFSRGGAAGWAGVAAWVLVAATLLGCSPRELLVRNVADSLAAGPGAEEDLALARDSAPVLLKASEYVLQQVPDHLKLAETVASGFTQYAYAFVAFEAERLETRDARAAQRLQQRAARLYRRAHRHAMAALLAHSPGLTKALDEVAARGPHTPGSAGTGTGWPPRAARPAHALPAGSVGAAYWAAASWGGWISMSKNEPDVVAELPRAHALARLAYEQEPTHGEGALAALMGSFEAARPGGSAAAAEAFFARAEAAGGGRNAGVFVAMAESLALPAGDRPRFEQLLRSALRAAAGRDDLASQAMAERATWLLATIDDRF